MRNALLSNAAGRVRAGWRVLFFFALLLTFGPAGGFLLALMGVTEEFMLLGGYAFLIGLVLAISALCLRLFDRLPLQSLGYDRRPGWARDYALGFALAAAMITAIVLIQLPFGFASVHWAGRPPEEALWGLLRAFLFFNVAALFEELTFRGYPLQTLLRDVHPALAVSIPSALFGLGHAGNPNASGLSLVNTALAGVWLSLGYVKTRRLWLPTGLHAGWNFTMSAVYGLTVSGLREHTETALFRAIPRGPEWVTGGAYGPEGGVLATGIMLGVTVWLWRTRWGNDSPLGAKAPLPR